MSAGHIRTFRIEDLPAARELWAASEGMGGPGDSPETMARFLDRNPGLSLVAVDGESIVATVLCGYDGRRGLLYRLAVAQSHRRSGLAAELVKRCLEGLKDRGIERCLALVKEDNPGGLAFWEAAGFHRRDLVVFSREIP